MYSYHTRSTSLRLTDRCRLATHRSMMRMAVGVDREMFTCRTTCRPPIRQLLCIHSRGAKHPTQPTQPVQRQIKRLDLWRSTFYVPDFLAQPAMSSVKELPKVYYAICNLCHTNAAAQHKELPLVGGNALSFPMSKARGMPRVPLTAVGPPQARAEATLCRVASWPRHCWLPTSTIKTTAVCRRVQ
jgi:hypothetical protein